MFDAQVRRRPDAVAVTFDGAGTSYRALDELANRIAVTLQKNGVRPENRVAVLMERSLQMVATLLGVIKLGAAYVPIDPSYPAERVAYMIEDSVAAALVTQLRL